MTLYTQYRLRDVLLLLNSIIYGNLEIFWIDIENNLINLYYLKSWCARCPLVVNSEQVIHLLPRSIKR